MVKTGDTVRIRMTGRVDRTGNSGVPGGDGYVLVCGFWFGPDDYEILTVSGREDER